jgi:hypothetical protein
MRQYDLDSSGTLDLEEFMSLMFKIQRDTIDISNDVLAGSSPGGSSSFSIVSFVKCDLMLCLDVISFTKLAIGT